MGLCPASVHVGRVPPSSTYLRKSLYVLSVEDVVMKILACSEAGVHSTYSEDYPKSENPRKADTVEGILARMKIPSWLNYYSLS